MALFGLSAAFWDRLISFVFPFLPPPGLHVRGASGEQETSVFAWSPWGNGK